MTESHSMIFRRNQDMLISVLDLEKVTVNDIMVPRNEIVGINVNDEWLSIIHQLTTRPTAVSCYTAIILMTLSACCKYARPTA